METSVLLGIQTWFKISLLVSFYYIFLHFHVNTEKLLVLQKAILCAGI